VEAADDAGISQLARGVLAVGEGQIGGDSGDLAGPCAGPSRFPCFPTLASARAPG
jgi:hypothetical protein